MIVRMSRITVMGPQELLMETLSLIQRLGIMQIDTESGTETVAGERAARSLPGDTKSVLTHQYYENLRKRIDELLQLLPAACDIADDTVPAPAFDSIAALLPDHIAEERKRAEEIAGLQEELQEVERYGDFLDTVGSLQDDTAVHKEVEWIGVQLDAGKDQAFLQERIERLYNGKTVIEAVTSDHGREIAVITTEKEQYSEVLASLERMGLEVYLPPDDLYGLPWEEQKAGAAKLLAEKRERLSALRRQQLLFARRWLPHYLKTRAWIDSHLSLIKVTADVVRTRMCFFIYGWLPAAELQILERELEENFAGRVIVEEVELAEKDFSRVPTALHNPVYFEPFELFTRLLPMPPYASFDLTPFIGIFFPVFFGMMLGDIGYGLLLLMAAVFIVRRFPARKNLGDAGKILFISSLYTIVFGLLYGEFFGTFGHTFLRLKPLFIDRQTSIIPMFCFAVAVGTVHVMIGLVLGIILSVRRKLKKEAAFKLINILVILCLAILAVSYFMPAIAHLQKPLLLTIGVITPVLFIVGGLMAPLELLKNVGNIISYARIMAIGLTSVLLAYVANYMAGRMGSVWAGIMVAVLLHLFNILLGIFAPTIHSLRLHYVEFLSKFMEPGGKEFKPLGGKK